MCHTVYEGQRITVGLNSLIPSCRSWGQNSGGKAWQEAPFCPLNHLAGP